MPTQRPDSKVLEHITSGIKSGHYRTDQRLPTERALSQQLGVPRSAVRDALAVLENDGAVTRLVGSGTFVRDAQLLQAPVSMYQPPANPGEIMEARLVVEPQLAALAAMSADQHDFVRLNQCIKSGDIAEDFETFEKWDVALHHAVADATHNRLVIELYAMITRARDLTTWGELKRRSLTKERMIKYRKEHHAIVSAIKARDAKRAEETLRAHLVRVKENLLGR